MNAVQAQKPQGWDKRAWIAAGVLSALPAILLLLLAFFSDSQNNDNTQEIDLPNFIDPVGLYVTIYLIAFGLAVFASVASAPLILGFMARQCSFLWGLLPSVFWGFLWFLFGVIKPISHTGINDLTPVVWQTVGYSVVASAFVTFIRWARSRDWL